MKKMIFGMPIASTNIIKINLILMTNHKSIKNRKGGGNGTGSSQTRKFFNKKI